MACVQHQSSLNGLIKRGSLLQERLRTEDQFIYRRGEGVPKTLSLDREGKTYNDYASE